MPGSTSLLTGRSDSLETLSWRPAPRRPGKTGGSYIAKENYFEVTVVIKIFKGQQCNTSLSLCEVSIYELVQFPEFMRAKSNVVPQFL